MWVTPIDFVGFYRDPFRGVFCPPSKRLSGPSKGCTIDHAMDRTDYRCNLEYRARVRSELLELVTRFLGGKATVIETARAVVRYSTLPESELQPFLNVFVGIDSETDALPVGVQRQHWSSEALSREDVKIAQAESRWSEAAHVAAASIAPVAVLERLKLRR